MTGGLLQLASVSHQDLYLNFKPNFSYFKKVYHKFSIFSKFMKKINFNEKSNFGQTNSCNIPINGDLLDKVNIEIDLPELNLDYKYKDKNDELYNLYNKNNYKKINNDLKVVNNNLNNLKSYNNEYNVVQFNDHVVDDLDFDNWIEYDSNLNLKFITDYLFLEFNYDVSNIFTKDVSIIKLTSISENNLDANYLVYEVCDDINGNKNQAVKLYLQYSKLERNRLWR